MSVLHVTIDFVPVHALQNFSEWLHVCANTYWGALMWKQSQTNSATAPTFSTDVSSIISNEAYLQPLVKSARTHLPSPRISTKRFQVHLFPSRSKIFPCIRIHSVLCARVGNVYLNSIWKIFYTHIYPPSCARHRGPNETHPQMWDWTGDVMWGKILHASVFACYKTTTFIPNLL